MTAALSQAGARTYQIRRKGWVMLQLIRCGAVSRSRPRPRSRPPAARRSAAGDSVVYFSGGGGLARLGAPPPVWCYPLT